MTRIIAGLAGGRRLRVPPVGTRPTSDRVREALFSALEARIDLDGCAVLDLFAGSGALGLEALSRGAEHVMLVESDAKAAAVIKDNMATVSLTGAVLRAAPVAAVVSGPSAREYDIVIADPPYAITDEAVISMLENLRSNKWVGEGTIVVLERSSRSPETAWPEGFEAVKAKKYGEARIELATCYGLDS
ncbi:16S rRNA (guanine(966)-N(2))-methyltransferase RsmD [Rhodococcus sp. SRB_17]|uniref:16S rRNA (guanine(966)-N(2))-methyltransferase RsmD n=1 Tax=unclassified Rhodococcus (in: high G+C Gram-positive bacteria) TaxID=192944 RepID=UPI000B93E924|nr:MULTISPECIES: 16S rRNA (guanine(966)-N(2))-methyltransferase RsmD [unclassified Rhodococcus (in: high G+C Gram-positive bacteria)]MCJ0904867.1 16S rRNA (guanine(966)-N(2))-methyltransferase RsmD [Rhodococcus sp. ARC_M6]NMM91460.1 16S rRNA (guanine(966)-N(2))-methyltransferase RsmD [Rhodococcus sp. SRB_17]OYD69386.1 16S rRNA (guanine966-N2)-methyltransferase [Rhodococcus sp. OK302]